MHGVKGLQISHSENRHLVSHDGCALRSADTVAGGGGGGRNAAPVQRQHVEYV